MSPDKSPNALRTIGEVAEDIGVATHVLRFWESKFSQIKPQKRRGRRYYRPEDIRIITQIKALLYGQGYTIRGVQKFLAEESKNKGARQKTLANMLIEEEKSSITPPKQQTEPDFDKFKTDLFGNIIPENDIKIETPITKTETAPKIEEPSEEFKTPPAVEQKKRFSENQIAQLEEIYFALLSDREKLQNLG